MTDFYLACRAADVWTRSVSEAFRRFQNLEGTEWEKKAFKKIKSLKPLSDSPLPPATTPKALEEIANLRESSYGDIRPDDLVKLWWQQAIVYEFVAEKLESHKPPESPVSKEDGSVSKLRDQCSHYAELLTQRTRSLRRGHLLTKYVIELKYGRDTNRAIDIEVTDLLLEVVKRLTSDEAQRSRSVDSPHQEQKPYKWMFDPDPEFCRSLYWPVPAIARFNEKVSNKQNPEKKRTKRFTATRPNLMHLSRILVEDAWLLYSDAEDELLDLWIDQLQMLFSLPDVDARGVLLEHFQKLNQRNIYWRLAPDSWKYKSLFKMSNLQSPEIELIPTILEDGTLKWDSLKDDEIKIVDSASDSSEGKPGCVQVMIGVKGLYPARVELTNDPDKERWAEWTRVRQLNNPELYERFLRQRDRICTGQPVEQLSEILRQQLKLPNGMDWFHKLVDGARKDTEKLIVLNQLLQLGNLSVFPELDPQGEPKWNDGFLDDPYAKRMPVSLRESVQSHSITKVLRFATSRETCRVEYASPIDELFSNLADLVRREAAECDQELLDQLDSFYLVVTNSDAPGNGEVVKPFLSLIETLDQKIHDRKLEPQMAQNLLHRIKEVSKQLAPPVKLLPSSLRLDHSWECPKEDGVEIEYEFSDDAPRGNVLCVKKFGAQIDNAIQTTASVLVSADKAPDGYEDLQELYPHLETCLEPQLVETLRQLPQQEVNDTTNLESLYTCLFKLIWPKDVSESRMGELNSDEKIQTLRDWYCQTVKAREVFEVIIPKKGDYLMTKEWESSRMYEEANPDVCPDPGDRVGEVARPMLILFKDRDVQLVVKEKAIIYVTTE